MKKTAMNQEMKMMTSKLFEKNNREKVALMQEVIWSAMVMY